MVTHTPSPLPASCLLFSPQNPSLQYLFCGISEIDVKDWKKHSISTNGYTNESPPVVWFWKVNIYLYLSLPSLPPSFSLPPSLPPSLSSSLSPSLTSRVKGSSGPWH